MHTVTYTNTDGNVMKLLLTDAEFERGLHRAQENAGDLNTNNARSDRLREVVGDGDPCSVNDLLGDADTPAGRRPING